MEVDILGMNILVTGGAGFIGAYAVRRLLEAGHRVSILDNFSEFLYSKEYKQDRVDALLPDFPDESLLRVDITDPASLKHVFANHSFDLVIHLAALANPGKSVHASAEYHQVNVEGTKNLLAAASHSGVARIIFAGSSSVYNDEVIPFKENTGKLRPRSPYGQTKVEAESLLRTWQQEQAGRQVTVLRFFSVYGPWGRTDQVPLIFARRIMVGEPIEVTAEERKRDFTYIDDIVAGIVAGVERPFEYEVINLGRGEPTTLQDFIAAIEDAAGKKATVVPRDTPDGEMRITYADVTKAQELLGYQPSVSVREGMANVVAWLKTYQFDT